MASLIAGSMSHVWALGAVGGRLVWHEHRWVSRGF